MDSIEVVKQLTIGGQKPLDQSAMQQLENKIIAPNQILYISTNGSDETGDGSINKPYRSIDFAATKIKNDVAHVEMRLDNLAADKDYPMHPIDFFNKGIGSFTMSISQWVGIPTPKANITLHKGKFHRYYSNGKEQFSWGNFIVANINTFSMNGINVNIGSDYIKYYDIGFLTHTKNLSMFYCTINATDFTLQMQEGLNNNLLLDQIVLTNYTGLLFADLTRVNAGFTEPTIGDKQIALAASGDITQYGIAPTTLQAAVYGGTTIPAAVLDYSLGERGIDIKTYIIYKNWN